MRVEIWNRTNTARLAILGAVSAVRRSRAIGREEGIQVSVSPEDPGVAQLSRAVVLRLQHGAEFSLWRLVRTISALTTAGRTLDLEAHGLWMDLRHGTVRQLQADGTSLFNFGLIGLTPAAWITDIILPGFDGDAIAFAAGVVELTDPVDLTFESTSPLDALRMLEQASGGELQWRYSADGQTCYVDLLQRVGTTGGAHLRYGKNIVGLERLEDDTEAVSRLYATGAGGLTLADAEWIVAGVSGAAGARVLTFVKSPVFEDGAFVGAYFRVAGANYPISASDVDTGSITVDEQANPVLAPGARGRLAPAAAGPYLSYLESPSARAAVGVRIGRLHADDVPDAANLLANGDFAAWSGGEPTGWSIIGSPTISDITSPTYARRGGHAVRIVAAASGEGILSDPIAVPTGDARRPYLGMLAGLTVASGVARMELRHSNGNVYPIGQRPGTQGVGVYLDLRAGPVHDEVLPAGTMQMAVVAHGGAADFYLDAAMLTPQVASDVPDFVRDQGAWVLWDRAVRDLELRSAEVREYRVSVADLYRIDPSRFAFEQLGLGDDVFVSDPEFGTDTLRIVEIAEDLLRPADTQVAVAPGPWQRPIVDDVDAFRPLYGPRRPGAAPESPAVVTGEPPVTTVSWAEQGKEGKILRLSVEPAEATIHYRLDGAATWQSRPGPSADIGVSIGASGYLEVEFYSSLAGGLTEETKYARLDKDAEPGFSGLLLSEATNVATAVIDGMDDDVVRWALWARLGGSPFCVDANGAETEELDSRYLRAEGLKGPGATQATVRMHTVNGTWQLVARVFDARGRHAQDRQSITVPTGAPPAGALSNLSATLNGSVHRLSWSHNAAADATYRVVIRESVDGKSRDVVTLATGGTGRNPTVDAGWVTGEPDVPGQGGYDVPVSTVPSGGVFKHFDYEILLYSGAQYVATYTVSIEGNTYAPDGGGAPTVSPGNLGLSLMSGGGGVPGILELLWENSSTAWSVEIEYQWYDAGQWRQQSLVQVTPGTSSHLTGGFPQARTYRAFARYVNSSGSGPSSTPSNLVDVP
jgi:hypothetical protein